MKISTAYATMGAIMIRDGFDDFGVFAFMYVYMYLCPD